MSGWAISAIIDWFFAVVVVVVSLFMPVHAKPPARDRNRRGFPVRITLWTSAAALILLGVISTIIASG